MSCTQTNVSHVGRFLPGNVFFKKITIKKLIHIMSCMKINDACQALHSLQCVPIEVYLLTSSACAACLNLYKFNSQ